MSDRILIWVALSVILAMVAGTTLQLRKPQFAPPLNLEMVVKANPPRPVATAASVDVDGVSKPFNSRITRPTLISFWATWCIPCLRELPTIGRFKAMADAAGIDVLTVSEDKEGAGPAVKLLAEKGLSHLPLVIDADGSLAKSMRVKGMPTTLIVNAKGEEVARMEGEVDWGEKSSFDGVISLLELAATPAR
ncbi:MAG: TlpA disulfide reductase family protein [Phaeospirillum sp.]|nr:TlpA disulfide reductase family protein [Phaeospirillum sp.]